MQEIDKASAISISDKREKIMKEKGPECRGSQVAAQLLGGFRATQQQQGTESRPRHIQPVVVRSALHAALLGCCARAWGIYVIVFCK